LARILATHRFARYVERPIFVGLNGWSGSNCDVSQFGGHAYHGTPPTDALAQLRDALLQTENCGFAQVRGDQQELGVISIKVVHPH